MDRSSFFSGVFLFYAPVFAVVLTLFLTLRNYLPKRTIFRGRESPVWNNRTIQRTYFAIACFLNILLLFSEAGFIQLKEQMVDTGSAGGSRSVSVFELQVYHGDSRGTVGHQSDNSYAYDFRSIPGFWTGHDTNEHPKFSDLRILEDGIPLGIPHSLHTEIAEKGGGRFSHWGAGDRSRSNVIFSASDNSDPTSNGRTYALETSLKLKHLAVLFIALFSMPLYAHLVLNLARTRETQEASPRTFLLSQSVILAGIVVLICLPLFEAWVFHDGKLSYSAIGYYLPWSDASGWAHGLQHLIHERNLDNWTVRRPLNLIHLTSFGIIGNLDLQWTLALRTIALGIAAFCFTRELWRVFGAFPAIGALSVVSAFSYQFAPTTLTESQGLTFGLAAVALLIHGVDRRNLASYALGTALLSVGMAIRTGGVFVLLSCILWPLLSRELPWRNRWTWCLTTFFAVLSGAAITAIWVAIFYQGDNAPGENFAYTLYGLTKGGLPWLAFYEDFDTSALTVGQKVSLAYKASFDNILNSPGLLLTGLYKFWTNYLDFRLFFVPSNLRTAVSLLVWLGLSFAVLRWRQPITSFLALAYCGVLLTAPVIFWGLDAYRAFIVTSPIDASLLALALASLYHLARGDPGNLVAPGSEKPPRGADKALVVFGAILLLNVTLIPAILLRANEPHSLQLAACTDGQYGGVFDIGRSSPYLHLVDPQSSERVLTPLINVNDFEASLPMGLEIRPAFSGLGSNVIIAHGYDLSRTTSMTTWIFGDYSLLTQGEGLYRLCGTLDGANPYNLFLVTHAEFLGKSGDSED